MKITLFNSGFDRLRATDRYLKDCKKQQLAEKRALEKAERMKNMPASQNRVSKFFSSLVLKVNEVKAGLLRR